MALPNAEQATLRNAMQRFAFEKFDKIKDSWDDYIFAFEQMCRAKGLFFGDHEEYANSRRTLLLANVGLEPLKIVRNHFRPADVNAQTYVNVKAALQGYYKPKITVFSARIDFMKRNRLENETMGQYANALRELADAADYGADVIDFILRDRFAAGVRHEKSEIELRQKWPNGRDGANVVTFDQVVRLADTIARAEVECTKGRMEANNGIENGSTKAQEGDTSSIKKIRDGRRRKKDQTPDDDGEFCALCGYGKHRNANKCPARDAECDDCGKTGHYARMCPERSERRRDRKKHETKALKKIREPSEESDSEDSESDESIG